MTGSAFGYNNEHSEFFGRIKKQKNFCATENNFFYRFYRNYKLMNTVQTPVCVVSENGIGVFMA